MKACLQFRTRTIFTMFLVASLVLVAPAARLARNRRERMVFSEVEALGGTVTYLVGSPGKWVPIQKSEGTRSWLQKWLDENFVASGVAVDLQRCENVNDGIVRQLASANSIRSMSLNGSGISDRVLVLLADMKNLEVLDVGSTAVSDSGLVSLQCDCLRLLIVHDCPQVTDEGVSRFRAKCSQCEVVFP